MINKIKVIGITGGVGSGKSHILTYLKENYDCCVIESDLIAKQLMLPGENGYFSVVKFFGNHILSLDKTIDTTKLGQLVFNDKKLLEELNHIVHPLVVARITEIINKITVPIVFVESAILFESGLNSICDDIWYIFVSQSVRKQRLLDSRNYSYEKTQSIMDSQMDQDKYKEKCNFVIDNSYSIDKTFLEIDKLLKNNYRI